MSKSFIALVVVVLSAVSAVSQTVEGTTSDAPRPASYWVAEVVAEAAMTVARWNALRHDRPTDGPCRGERVDKPEHCSAVIMASVLKNDQQGAVAAILDRVGSRPKPLLRAALVHAGILKRFADRGGGVDPPLIAGFTARLAEQVGDEGCAQSIRINAVQYWINVGDLTQAASYLRGMPIAAARDHSVCTFDSPGYAKAYRHAVLDEPLNSERDVHFLEASGALIHIGRAPSAELREKLADLAIGVSAASGIRTPVPLLIETARDMGDTQLERWLRSK